MKKEKWRKKKLTDNYGISEAELCSSASERVYWPNEPWSQHHTTVQSASEPLRHELCAVSHLTYKRMAAIGLFDKSWNSCWAASGRLNWDLGSAGQEPGKGVQKMVRELQRAHGKYRFIPRNLKHVT